MQTAAPGAIPRLGLTGIRKSYPSVVANDGIDLTVMPGEIHAVLGENGAGKSTLMKIIYGVVKPDEGEIRWEGRPVAIANPHAARALGIAMVFQHFSLFDTLTAAENVWLGLDRSQSLTSVDRRDPRQGRRVRPRGRPAAAGAHALGRRTAAGGDRARAPHGAPAADSRRADIGTHAAGGREAVRHAASPRRARLQHPLHQPQARRDPRAVPRVHRAPRRARDRASPIRAPKRRPGCRG